MGHVEESASGIPLDPHILGLGQPRKWTESTRPCNFRLVILMCSQVGYAPDGIALDLDVGRQHLANQGRQPAELDDQDFVLG